MAGQVITTVDELQRYLGGVSERAEHHAGEVGEVVLAIAGAIVLFKDRGSELRVMAREGVAKNLMWVMIGGERYVFTYNHDNETVDVKEGTVRGAVIRSFDNRTPTADVITFFASLRDG